jgi:hypothetical protein
LKMYTISSIPFPHAPLYLVCKKEKKPRSSKKNQLAPGKNSRGLRIAQKKLSEAQYRAVVGVLRGAIRFSNGCERPSKELT